MLPFGRRAGCRLALALGIFATPGPHVGGPPTRAWLVVPVTAASAVVILDAQSLAPIRRVPVLGHPQDVVASPLATRVFVLEMGSDSTPGHTVAELDVAGGNVVRRIDLDRCFRPHLGRVSRDGRTLWIACVPFVVEVDLARGIVARRWELPGAGGWNFDVTPDERILVVADFDDSSATLVTRASGALRKIRLSGQPIGVAAGQGNVAWIGTTGTDSLYVVQPSTGSIVARFKSAGSDPARIAFGLNGRVVVVANSRSNSVSIYDAKATRLIRSVPVGGAYPKGLVLDRAGRAAFVSLMESNELIRLDLESGTITARTAVGGSPERAAWVARR
jgi:YVTN family beta-propeller protein